MQTLTRTLLAFALGASLAAPPAIAADKDPAAKTPTPTRPTVEASDAVSQRATTRETGRVKAPLNTTSGAGSTVGAAAAANPGKGNWWADADIDGDGQLSLVESRAQAGLEARFANVDGDADGFVSNDEYRKFFTDSASQGEVHATPHSAVVTRDVWLNLDSNADGKLSSTEVATNTGISGAFSSIDSNRDGFVTQAEYSAYAKANMK